MLPNHRKSLIVWRLWVKFGRATKSYVFNHLHDYVGCLQNLGLNLIFFKPLGNIISWNGKGTGFLVEVRLAGLLLERFEELG